MNIFLQIKKRLMGKHVSDVAATEEALQTLDQELEQVQAILNATRAKYGDSLIAGATQEAERIEQTVQDSERMIHRLQVARAAVAERLIYAKAERERGEQARLWDDTRKALAARRDAFVALDAAATAFAKAYADAVDATDKANEAMPLRIQRRSGGVDTPIIPQFTDLAPEATRLLALATGGRFGPYSGSALWELQQQPGLLARADAAASEWLALTDTHQAEAA